MLKHFLFVSTNFILFDYWKYVRYGPAEDEREITDSRRSLELSVK